MHSVMYANTFLKNIFSIIFIKFESNPYCIEYFSMYSTSSLVSTHFSTIVLGTSCQGCAVLSGVYGPVPRTMERSVDILNIHQGVKLLSFLRSQHLRLYTKGFSHLYNNRVLNYRYIKVGTSRGKISYQAIFSGFTIRHGSSRYLIQLNELSTFVFPRLN